MKVAPAGLDNLMTTLCGSSANENAFKAAFMAYRARERNNADFTQEELGQYRSPAMTSLLIDRLLYGQSKARIS